jgi:hypothetical protein
VLTATRIKIPATITALCLALTVLWTVAAPKANAITCPTGWVVVTDSLGHQYCQVSQTGGTPGNPGSPGSGYTNTCVNNQIVYAGKTYLCNIPDAQGNMWSFSFGCYLYSLPASEQPPASSPLWTAKYNPGNGGWMSAMDCNDIPPSLATSVDQPGPCPGGGCGATQGSTQTITADLAPTPPAVNMSPAVFVNGAVNPNLPNGATGFVNQNIWLWLTTPLDIAPMPATSGSGLMALKGLRTFTSIDWRITGTGTDGKPLPSADLHCLSADPYQASDGDGPSLDPLCNYQFTHPGTYQITVTTTWQLSMTYGNGTQIPPGPMTSNAVTGTIKIGESESTNG